MQLQAAGIRGAGEHASRQESQSKAGFDAADDRVERAKLEAAVLAGSVIGHETFKPVAVGATRRAGQSATLARPEPARELVQRFWTDAKALLE